MAKYQRYERLAVLFMILALGSLIVALFSTKMEISIGFSYYTVANLLLCRVAHQRKKESDRRRVPRWRHTP